MSFCIGGTMYPARCGCCRLPPCRGPGATSPGQIHGAASAIAHDVVVVSLQSVNYSGNLFRTSCVSLRRLSAQMTKDFCGDAVLCMPRDLFKDSSPVFIEGRDECAEEESTNLSARGSSLQGCRLLLSAVSSLRHRRLPPAFPSSTPYHAQYACQDGNDDGPTDPESNGSSSTLPLNSGARLCPPSTQWSFRPVASLHSNRCSLASDVIAAIDFNAAGSLFATGGIARKIRVCSYAAILGDHTETETFRAYGTDDADDSDEERQLLGPHGKGRSRQKLRSCKRKVPDKDGAVIQSHDESALRIINVPAKLSSLKWRPLDSGVIGCGDYDGVVTEWDVEQGLCLSERYEHCGQRIWSVDYSSWFPTLCASASGDGTVRLWTLNCEKSVGIIRSPGGNSICCAEFSSEGSRRVALACADSNVYVYDVRRLDSSLLCLKGHGRAASYARFLGSEELVSASIDNSVKLWNISPSNELGMHRGGRMYRKDGDKRIGPLQSENSLKWRQTVHTTGKDETFRLLKTFNSHTNVKNFVGLSVWKEGALIACGSESNEIFVYDKNNKVPIWQMKFETDCFHTQPGRRRMGVDMLETRRFQEEKCFVGAVCWQEQRDHHALLAANSEGTLQLIKVTPV